MQLKKPFLILATLVALTAGAYWYADQPLPFAEKLSPVKTALQPTVEQFLPDSSQKLSLPKDSLAEMSTFTERGKEITEHVGAVLGESVSEVPAENQPLHERALEYGQYQYCKAVVEEYEARTLKE